MGREECISIVESCFAFLLKEMLDEFEPILEKDRSSSDLKDELPRSVPFESGSELIDEGLEEVCPSIHEGWVGVHCFVEEGLNDELDGFGGRVVGEEEGLEKEWEIEDGSDKGEGC